MHPACVQDWRKQAGSLYSGLSPTVSCGQIPRLRDEDDSLDQQDLVTTCSRSDPGAVLAALCGATDESTPRAAISNHRFLMYSLLRDLPVLSVPPYFQGGGNR